MGSGSSKASSTASNPRPLSASQTSLAVGRRPAAPHKSQRNPLQACVSSAATLVSASTRSQEAEEKPSDTDNSPSPSETPTNPLGTDALVTHSPIQRAFAPPTPPLPILRPSSGKHRPGSGGPPRLIPSLAPTPHESSLTQHISYFRSYLQSRMSDGDGMENACPSENNQGGRVLTSAEVKAVMALALDLSEVAGRQPRESGDDLSGQSPTTTSTDRLMVVNDEKDDAHVLLRELMEEDHPFEPSHFTTYQREGNTVGFQLDEKDRPAGVSAKAVSTIEQSSQLGISSTITSRSHGHSAHRRQRTHVHKLFHCPTVQASPIVGSEGLRSNEGSPISNPFALCVEQAECIAATHDAINGVSAVAMDISAMLQSWILLLDQYDLFSKDLITEVIATCPSSREELLPQVSVPNKIMGMIHLAVVQYTKPDEILSVLTEAGARHRLYGVHHEHYVILQNAFMRVYPKYLPDDVYHRTDAMWKIFWRSIIELLSKGAQTERGAIFEQEHRVAWSHHIQSIMSVLAERQCGNADDDREHFFFSEMYQKAKKMANDTSDTSLQKMVERFAAVSSARTGDRAMNALLRIVDNLEDEAAVDDYLDDLGEQHMLLGLNMAIMNHFRQPFLDTCGHYMHNHELWTPNAQHAMGEFWDYMVEAWNDEFSNAHLSGTLDLKNVGAPDSAEPFCLIFTDVEASTRLWQSNHEVMAAAIQNHHRIIRGVVTDYNGYEVKTVGDSFLIATKDALTALKIALAIQLEFMRVPITEGFKMIDNPQGGGDPVCWRDDSLRIRIGIHYCTDVSAVYDTVHQRYDYYGPDVNCAARVEASACGGQVLMTKAALDALHAIPGFMTEPRPRLLTGYDIGTTNERSITFSCLLDKSLPGTPSSPATPSVRPLSSYVSFKDVGPRELKGITEPMQLFEVVHSALGGRMFDARAHEMTSFAVLTTFPLDQADSGKFCLSEQ